jgi:oxygen-independent coproporphyrinogen-3 oxidase
MFCYTIKQLKNAGYVHYEISNFCLPGFESRHNCLYWKNEPYVGIGASACSYIHNKRYCALADVKDYIRSCSGSGVLYCSQECLPAEKSLRETAALNLRLIERGIFLPDLDRRFPDVCARQILREPLRQLMEEKLLIEKSPDRYCLTEKGVLFADYAAVQIV